tara:strand:+ start:2135 stop:2827 length:693 start_codon:yes stop_codon:yes gene_type:complete
MTKNYLFFIIILLLIILAYILKKNIDNFSTKDNKLYIITPSIGRNNLIRTCNSIHKQKNKNWTHIILFDGLTDDKINKITKKLPYKPIIKKGIWKNYGNGQRYEAWELVKNNSIITYIDDDDYYKDENVFDNIINKFKKNKNLDVVFWAGLREGKLIHNKPPRKNKTMSNQFAHYKFSIKNKPIRWLYHKKNDNNYSIDGLFIDNLVKKFKYDYIDKVLVIVEESKYGKL